jgi:hypothetical protein
MMIRRENLEFNKNVENLSNEIVGKVKNKVQSQGLFDIMNPADRKTAEEVAAKAS